MANRLGAIGFHLLRGFRAQGLGFQGAGASGLDVVFISKV